MDLDRTDLIESAQVEDGLIRTATGALIVGTGKCTGRSPEAKFIVEDESTADAVDWENTQSMSPAEYSVFYRQYIEHVNSSRHYTQVLYAGNDHDHQLQLAVHTSTAWQALFANNMFVRHRKSKTTPSELWHLYSFPEYSEDPKVVINFDCRTILIAGTLYAGEIKKSVFTVLNFILTDEDILPMHCSVNVDTEGENAAVFFGLSGTGKTTLSADYGRRLVGDDEHGWSARGLFNFEGGCYAKVIDLTKSSEPEIWDAVQRPGAILENVVVNFDGKPDFTDSTLTENTRGSYPIHHIPNAIPSGEAGHPSNIMFLTCDAFGVLPPVSRLLPEEAVRQFMMGYTAKVAGTEAGIDEPVATFSPCFGAPFMPRPAEVYAGLLREKIEERNVSCWLVNTGWSGGGYGTGERMPIGVSRAAVRSIISGELNQVPFTRHEPTQLSIPRTCPNSTLNEYLVPEDSWKDKEGYARAAKNLMEMWSAQMNKFSF